VSHYLQNPRGVAGRVPAAYAKRGTEIFETGSIRAAGTELLDMDGKAM